MNNGNDYYSMFNLLNSYKSNLHRGIKLNSANFISCYYQTD